MKKHLAFPCLILMLLVLTGCPTGLPHPLGNPGTEKIDQNLIGEWITDNPDAEAANFKIAKKDNYSYSVEVLQKGEMYSITSTSLTGWITKLDGQNFFYLKPSDEESYYLYAYKLNGKTELITYDVSLLVGGVDAVTSTSAFRDEVSKSLKQPNCLSGEKVFKKK